MRIIAGTAGGRVIAAPKGRRTRPMTGRVRGAIFNILADAVVGAEVLDLFAGSGCLGLEALSRGAARCVFVERDRAAASVLRTNIEALRFGERARVIVADASRAVGGRAGGPFDLIFVDPPYAAAQRLDEKSEIGCLVGNLFDRAVLKPAGRVVLRAPRRAGALWTPAGVEEADTRLYGADCVRLLRHTAT